MNQNESIEHVLENMDKSIVCKTKGSGITAILLIVTSVFLLAVYASFEWNPTDSLPHSMFILGSILGICGIMLFFFRKSFFVSVENQQKIKMSEAYFQMTEQGKLVGLVEAGKLTEMIHLKPSISDGLKIRVMATKDGQLCLSQVIAYVNNEYANLTEVRKHTVAEADFLAEYLRKNKN
jgi:hypothetical protein